MTPVTEAAPAIKLTERINRIEPSATMAVVAEADKLRQQGIDVVDFGAGEPHFSTPQHIKDAAISAIESNFSKYTAVGGTPELRDAIVHRHTADFQSEYRREECMASVGGKHALFNAIQVLVDHGDEVILPVPYWVSFKDIVRYAGGNCVLLEADENQGFRVTAEMISRLVTPRTKMIILNSPSNPSGAVMSPKDLKAVVQLATERGIWGTVRRVLRISELHGREFFRGIVARVPKSHGDYWFTIKDLCDDGMATRLRAGTRNSVVRHAETAESVDLEPDFHRAESRSGCAERSAAMRGTDARGIHQAARSRGPGAARHPRS